MTEDKPMAQITISVVIDEDGDYEVGKDRDEAMERYAENIGGDLPRSIIEMAVDAPTPRTIEVAATLPAKEDGSYSLEIKS